MKPKIQIDWGLVSWVCLTAFIGALLITDDTDEGFFSRSEMRLHTDARTGCQYLSTFFGGGPSPRMSADGKHMCEEQSQ